MQILKELGESFQHVRANLASNVSAALEKLDEDVSKSLEESAAKSKQSTDQPTGPRVPNDTDELSIYKQLLDEAHMEHLALSKNSRLLLAQKEADVIYWKRKSGISEEVPDDDSEQLSMERLKAEKASLEESLVIMGSQLREAIRDSNEVKAMMAKCDDSQGQYDLLKQEFTKHVADAEKQEMQKSATIDGLVAEYSKLAAEMEVRQQGESTRLLEVMRENETLATRIRALEHSLSALADRAVLSAIEAEDNHNHHKDNTCSEHRTALEEGENQSQGKIGGSGGVDEGKEKEKQWLIELKEVKARLVNAQFDLKEKEARIHALTGQVAVLNAAATINATQGPGLPSPPPLATPNSIPLIENIAANTNNNNNSVATNNPSHFISKPNEEIESLKADILRLQVEKREAESAGKEFLSRNKGLQKDLEEMKKTMGLMVAEAKAKEEQKTRDGEVVVVEVERQKEKEKEEKEQLMTDHAHAMELMQKEINDHISVIAKMKNDHEKAVEQLISDHVNNVAMMTTNHSKTIESMQLEMTTMKREQEAMAVAQGVMEKEMTRQKQQLQEQESSQESKLQQALKTQQSTLEASHASAVAHAQQQHTTAIHTIQQQHAQALVQARNDHTSALALALQEHQKLLDISHEERDEYKALYSKESKWRKQIHNKLLELQGNIRVICRVRPILDMERNKGGGEGQALDVTDISTDQDITITKDEKTKAKYEFDKVFPPGSTQLSVFEAVQPLCLSVLDGYNVCIFAYGQTGSGKTFTIEGTQTDLGVSPRAVSELFRVIDTMHDWSFTVIVSMLEVYNETLRDLLHLNNNNSSSNSSNNSGSMSKGPVAAKDKNITGLDIRQTNEGNVVPGLTEVQVNHPDQVLALMTRGHGNRAVGSHDMNEHSSRSHSITTLTCRGKNNVDQSTTYGKLHLIDLAGSERISKTDATGDRLKEAQNINRSLSALGDVINALGNKKSTHVPYRNSKLTFLLQDSLGGNSKVIMFVNISPAVYNVSETVCSLNFASRCRNVELGQAKTQTDNKGWDKSKGTEKEENGLTKRSSSSPLTLISSATMDTTTASVQSNSSTLSSSQSSHTSSSSLLPVAIRRTSAPSPPTLATTSTTTSTVTNNISSTTTPTPISTAPTIHEKENNNIPAVVPSSKP